MSQRRVSELMTSDVLTVHPDASFKAVVRALDGRGVDAVPVVDQHGDLLGVVSGSDLTCHEEEPATLPQLLLDRSARLHARKARGRCARELMSSPARTIEPDATVCAAASAMARGHVGRLVVVDRGRVVGMLTRSDLLRVYLRDDEEIARDVREAVRQALGGEAGEVQVTVVDGVVRLRGWVEWASCATRAHLAAADVTGVVDVESEVEHQVDDSVMHQVALHGPYA